MSLSLAQKLLLRIDKIKQQKRQSFGERICDDLCEELLKHLCLKDKGRLECVSKQFQRNIFLSFKSLHISNDVFWMEDRLDETLIRFNSSAFQTIVNKCPNINQICLNCIYFEENHQEYNRLIELIIQNCNHLRRFVGRFDLMKGQIREQFIERFSSKLTHLKLNSFSPINGLNSLKNLRVLDLMFDSCYLSDVCELQLKRLKTLRIASTPTTQMDHLIGLPTLLRNVQSLQYLKIKSYTTDVLLLKAILEQISRLHSLVALVFYTPMGLNHKSLNESFRQIARNCLNLNTIRGVIIIDLSNCSDMSQLLSSFRQFKELKQLGLFIGQHPLLEHFQFFSCKAFKGLENLTQLVLAPCSGYLEDTVLEDIDINLPQLKYVEIKSAFNATNWTHIILSRLTDLETIKLNVIDDDIREIIEIKLAHNCKKLKTLIV